MDTIDKVLRFVIPEPNSGCWLWLGYTGGKGYPQIRYNGPHRYAHHIIYEHYVGTIPKELELDHTCNVTFCVNPDHMEPVTHTENNRRIWIRGRSNFDPSLGARTSDISPRKRNRIKELRSTNTSIDDIAYMVDISKSSVLRVLKGAQ